jgi:hypothetical protein
MVGRGLPLNEIPEDPEPGFDLSRSAWQSVVGQRLLTPRELAARVRYFSREADRAIARARRSCA